MNTKETITEFYERTRDKKAKRGEGIAVETAKKLGISIDKFYRLVKMERLERKIRSEYEN